MTQSTGTYPASRWDSSDSSDSTGIIGSVLFFVVLLVCAVFYSLSFLLQLLLFSAFGRTVEADVDRYE